MKTVIVQTLWGDGILCSPLRNKRAVPALHTYCIPSVRRYAERHGYSYILHRTDKLHFRFSIDKKVSNRQTQIEFNSLMGNDHFNSCFERYYVMNGLSEFYERFIYLDLDVYVKSNAPAMPYESGVWAFHEWQLPHEDSLRRGFSEVPDKHQFNSGVLVMDRKGVKSVYDYLCKTKPDSRCTGDQDYFRLWSLKNKVNHLDGVWNHMTRHTRSRDGHFIHYAGEKLWIVLEMPPFYLRPFYWCEYVLSCLFSPANLYFILKSMDRAMRRTRTFQHCRRLWKRARA